MLGLFVESRVSTFPDMKKKTRQKIKRDACSSLKVSIPFCFVTLQKNYRPDTVTSRQGMGGGGGGGGGRGEGVVFAAQSGIRTLSPSVPSPLFL